MSTFFSGTDTATLNEEGTDRNHFVSLIVNNEGTYTAAITRRVKSIKEIKDDFIYPTFNDEIVADSKSYTSENEEIEWFYLTIEFEKNDTYRKDIKDRLNEIRKVKEEKKQKTPYSHYNPRNTWKSNYPTQGTLFDDLRADKGTPILESITDKELPFDYNYIDCKEDDELINLEDLKFNKQTIKSLVLQLITGSVILPNESKVDARKWAIGMTSLYKKRFGEGEPGMRMFRIWADSYIEYICWFTEDDKLKEAGLCDEEIAAVCAKDLIAELEKLPMNEYIKSYIEILKSFLI